MQRTKGSGNGKDGEERCVLPPPYMGAHREPSSKEKSCTHERALQEEENGRFYNHAGNAGRKFVKNYTEIVTQTGWKRRRETDQLTNHREGKRESFSLMTRENQPKK